MSNQIPQTEIDRIKGQANLYATGSAELYEAVYRANYDGRLSEYLHRSSAAPEPERAEGGYGEFNIGEWVICRFGNSGNKFWPQLAGAILRIADVVRHNEKPDQISFHFDQAQFFYANDFERVIIPNVPIGPFTGPVTPSPVSTPTALGTEGEEKGLCRWVKAGVRLPEKDGKIGIRIHGEDLSNGSVRTRKNGDRVICPFGLHSIWPGWKELEWLEELLSSQPTTSGEEKEFTRQQVKEILLQVSDDPGLSSLSINDWVDRFYPPPRLTGNDVEGEVPGTPKDIEKWIRDNNPCGIYEYNTWRKGAKAAFSAASSRIESLTESIAIVQQFRDNLAADKEALKSYLPKLQAALRKDGYPRIADRIGALLTK